MPERTTIKILSISQYGADLASGSAFSGALLRQREYAEYVTKYIVLVPSAEKKEELSYGDSLRILPLYSRGTLRFLFNAYTKSIELYAQDTYDVIMVDNPHIGGVLGVVLKLRLGLPLVVHSMADVIYNPWYRRERVSNRLKDVLIRFVVKSADIIRISTQFEYSRLSARYIDNKKLFIFPFYIDETSFLKRMNGTAVIKIPKSILFVGRLSYQKDLSTLLRAMKIVLKAHPTARLRIVGKGSEEEAYVALAGQLGISHNVDFLGAVPYDLVADEFKKATLFALSSLYEGTCMVLHEAALAQLPIISTDVAGAHDFVRNGVEGHLVPVRDAVSLGETLSRVLDDEKVINAMGKASRLRMASFGKEHALALWQELCKKIETRIQERNTTSSV